MAYTMLDEGYVAETGKTFVIAMGTGEIIGENMEFVAKPANSPSASYTDNAVSTAW